ncbi:hypothetical protein VNO80_27155 [Phaseolus coccineus]|uniref:Uncharacterized protein n=1 Tax=Phaseolus coccineus TaxID=3886 RepID=A0AAN9LJK5_PHACN
MKRCHVVATTAIHCLCLHCHRRSLPPPFAVTIIRATKRHSLKSWFIVAIVRPIVVHYSRDSLKGSPPLLRTPLPPCKG